ncbi:MAG: VanZ family protein [Firmicutes bacterium]|nr:VanZ family protein [Candidatus Fiminaster equi]
MKKRNVYKWIIFGVAIATNLFILVNSFIFGDASNVESSAITSSAASVVNNIVPGAVTKGNYESFVVFIRKTIGHFALFGFSGVVSTWAIYLFARFSKFNYFIHFGCLSLLFGIALSWLTEFIQLFVPGRSGSVADVMIDFVGYFIGDLLMIFVLFLAKKPIFHKEEKQEK